MIDEEQKEIVSSGEMKDYYTLRTTNANQKINNKIHKSQIAETINHQITVCIANNGEHSVAKTISQRNRQVIHLEAREMRRR